MGESVRGLVVGFVVCCHSCGEFFDCSMDVTFTVPVGKVTDCHVRLRRWSPSAKATDSLTDNNGFPQTP